MDRINQERTYWDRAAQDPEVDQKYISDISVEKCKNALGPLSGRVLDLGCGVGRLMDAGWYGVDISEKMIEVAEVRRPDCYFKACNGRSIPFDEIQFDVIYCVLLFQHLPLPAIFDYIKEVRWCLVDNGIFRFQFIEGTENKPFSKHHSLEKIKFALSNTGFQLLKIDKGLCHPQWTWITAQKI